MKWIRVDTSTPDHPRMMALALALDVSPIAAFGHYTALCCRMGEHCEDGQLDAVPDLALEGWALWRGAEGRLARAIRELCQEPDGSMKGWWRQEKLKERAEKARERMRTVRKQNANSTRTKSARSHTDVIDVSLRAVVGKEKETDADFEAAWAAYPKRPGNSRKAALKAWKARLADGVEPAALLAGLAKYAAYVRAEGWEGTNKVKMAATFFGPDEHWLSDFTARIGPKIDPDDALALRNGWPTYDQIKAQQERIDAEIAERAAARARGMESPV